MPDSSDGTTDNTISGGTQHAVLQGQNFRDVHIGDAIQATSAPVALAQLPPLEAGFTGRDQEIAEIISLLTSASDAGAVVVSALAGLAGVGKTALAVQSGHAARQAGWFPGGVLFIDLHGYDAAPVQPGQALDALLRALGVPGEHIPPGVEERAGLYRSALGSLTDPVLVIADNASSEAQVRPVLPGPGPHRVIVTSRHTLAGLGARLLDITILNIDEGVVLLDAALRAARPEDDRISRNPTAGQRLARACGGLPLALRITAALLATDPALTAGDVGDELSDEMQRLEALRYDDGGGTSAPSVAAAFELSYRQLEQTAARLFRLLPTNPGPDLSLAAAVALAGSSERETRKVLGQLAKAHLVEVAAGVAGRWRMHDLLRLYACQLSDTYAEADKREQARDRLLDFYLKKAQAADTHLRALPGTALPADFTGRDDALAWLDAERPNLISAVNMASRTGRDQFALRLPLNLNEYLSWRRRFDDRLTILAISQDAARRLGDRSNEAGVMTSLGITLRNVRRFDEAITAHQDAAAIYRETRDRHSEAMALNNLGTALVEVRRFDEAITAHQDAAAIYRETRDRHSEGNAVNNLGLALVEVRRFDEAITAHQDAAAIYRETRDRHSEGMAVNNLGLALVEVRRFDEAITAHQDAAAIFRETGDRHREGMGVNNLGIALVEVRRFDEAITAHQDAAAIYQETRDRHSEAKALNNLGIALRGVGRFDEAITAHQDAAAIYRETGDRHREGNALNNLGLALRGVGRFDEAITAHQDAAAIYRETGDRHREAKALNNLGLALRGVGRFDEAITAHQDAAAIYRETGDRHSEGTALNNLELDRAAQTGSTDQPS
jgi:tetratricopeptide (TPR) repeat protein